MKSTNYLLFFIAIIIFTPSCKDDDIVDNAIPEFVMAGGETTIFDATSNAYATPAPNLSSINFERHLEGDLAFEQIFVTDPAEVNPGLGPVFNNNSCVSCHIRNGRSIASNTGDDLSGFLLRISVDGTDEYGGPKPVPLFGTQLQNKVVFGYEGEGSFSSQQIDESISFMDGSTVTLSKNNYEITNPYQTLPNGVMISPRVAPAVFGLGLLEAIKEEDIINQSDPNDTNGDGISGKPNMVWNIEEQALTLGRFGWKALSPTARQQTADAYHQDMGVTNELFTEESCSEQDNCLDDGIVDISNEILDVTAFYFQSLAVPAVRNYDDEQVTRGRALFEDINCSSCHVPRYVTGEGVIPEVSQQVIYPYTDLLLHDMGEGLADNRPSFDANGQEWKTPPLWGIGLLPVVNGHSRLLHDGRARNITEAILWHGGEAEDSKQEFISLSGDDRQAVIQFLESL
ncbi:MAG: CxxC motif-containing protein (DUF1111 family) [Maribacter sp.]|jgi:CxxC motif-containing protein (DUF1111 family)